MTSTSLEMSSEQEKEGKNSCSKRKKAGFDLSKSSRLLKPECVGKSNSVFERGREDTGSISVCNIVATVFSYFTFPI